MCCSKSKVDFDSLHSQLIHHGKSQSFPCSLKTFKVNTDSLKRENNKKKCIVSVASSTSSLSKCSGTEDPVRGTGIARRKSEIDWEQPRLCLLSAHLYGRQTWASAVCLQIGPSCSVSDMLGLGFLAASRVTKVKVTSPGRGALSEAMGQQEGSPWLSLQPLAPEGSSLSWHLLVSDADFHQVLVVEKFENQDQLQTRFQDRDNFCAIFLEEPFDVRFGYISQTLTVKCKNLKEYFIKCSF